MSEEWFRGTVAFSCTAFIFFGTRGWGVAEARVGIVLLSRQMMMKQENVFMDGSECFILPLIDGIDNPFFI